MKRNFNLLTLFLLIIFISIFSYTPVNAKGKLNKITKNLFSEESTDSNFLKDIMIRLEKARIKYEKELAEFKKRKVILLKQETQLKDKIVEEAALVYKYSKSMSPMFLPKIDGKKFSIFRVNLPEHKSGKNLWVRVGDFAQYSKSDEADAGTLIFKYDKKYMKPPLSLVLLLFQLIQLSCQKIRMIKLKKERKFL
jgi:cell division protein FtsB